MESRTKKLRQSHNQKVKSDLKKRSYRHGVEFHDSSVRKGADIVRRRVEDSSREANSETSPTSILDINDDHISQVYWDLQATEKSWENSTTPDPTVSGRNSRMTSGVVASPPSDNWRKFSSPKSTKRGDSKTFWSAGDSSSALKGLGPVGNGYIASAGNAQSAMSANDKRNPRKNLNSNSQGLDGAIKSNQTYSNRSHNYNDNRRIQDHQTQDVSFPCDDWDSASVEINEIQNNLYLLNTNDYNNDNNRGGSFARNMDYEQNDDIFTVDDSQSNQLSTESRKNSYASQRSNRNRYTIESPQSSEDKRQSSKSFSFRSLRPSGLSIKSGSTRSARSEGTFNADVDVGSVPSPMTFEYSRLLQDPAYRHAQKAGFLWQSIMGQHIRFPSSWWHGARAPPMGVSDIESCKWAYFVRLNVKDHYVLNQLHPGRSSPGKLLLHVLVQDAMTRQTIQDIAIGCFHPSARGIRQTTRASSSLEESRDLWLAVRKRNKTSGSTIDRLLSRYSQFGPSGYTKSPLGPEVRISNHNVRAVFGETPPLETMFVVETELYDRVSRRIAAQKRAAINLPLQMLQEFVFAEDR